MQCVDFTNNSGKESCIGLAVYHSGTDSCLRVFLHMLQKLGKLTDSNTASATVAQVQ
jgi:hypothetical protein